MGASNDEDGCRPDQRVLFVTRQPPVGESNRTRGDRNIKENCGGTVGKGLCAGCRSLCGGHKPNNARESGLLADSRNADTKASATGDRSCGHSRTWSFRYCPRLTGDHRLVNIGVTFDHRAIRWDPSSRPDENYVIHVQFRQWNSLNIVAILALSRVW